VPVENLSTCFEGAHLQVRRRVFFIIAVIPNRLQPVRDLLSGFSAGWKAGGKNGGFLIAEEPQIPRSD
jgi:hypothetical protein